MARIRSIHPGLASDEAFMTMSMAAKAAWAILWTECDDHGVFEWKPIVLKARIFPAESLNFADILAEYEALGCIMKAEVDGKPYGFIRNFCKFQRPKNPSYRLPLPECARLFVGDFGSPTPALPQPYPSPTEIVPQMKEEGGRKEEEKKEPSSLRSEGSARAKPSPVECRLPKDWQPSESLLALARQELGEFTDLSRTVSTFRDYWHARAGPSARKRDWDATFRNWVRREHDSKSAHGGSRPAPTGRDRHAAAGERGDALRAGLAGVHYSPHDGDLRTINN